MQAISNTRRNYLSINMALCIFTGFSSGLPLFILFNLVPAWLRSERLDLTTLGFFALVQLPYTFKFLWSPLLDRYRLGTQLGRRRGWMMLMHLLIFMVVAVLGQLSPVHDIGWIILGATLLAFFSATLDIVIDAFRRERLCDEELGMGNGIHIAAYRIAGLVPGSLSLILADHLPWTMVFWGTALFVLPGLVLCFFVRESEHLVVPKTLQEAVVLPFVEFINRHSWQNALWILAFIFFYKLGDSLCTALATPFYLDMGYSKTHIGLIAKNAGLWPVIIGGIVGGILTNRWGISRALWIFGFIQAGAIVGFALLAMKGHQQQIDDVALISLAMVIGIEALAVGLGTAPFVSYIAIQTNPAYTVTQFALFTSLASAPRTIISSAAGWLIDHIGYFNFYLLCILLAVPGMLLLLKVAPWSKELHSPKLSAVSK